MNRGYYFIKNLITSARFNGDQNQILKDQKLEIQRLWKEIRCLEKKNIEG